MHPPCPSLARWSADSVMVTTERGPIAPSTTQGRVNDLAEADDRDLRRVDDAVERLDAALPET